MKRSIGLLVVVLAVSALGGCFLLGPPVIDFMGRALRVDSDGHFKDDVVYQYVDEDTYEVVTRSFTADGTYEYTEEAYDGAGEQWIITYGRRYDYTVNTDDFTLTTDYTHWYDGTQWQPGTNDNVQKFNAYFAQSKYSFDVMVADPDADDTFTTTYHETTDGLDDHGWVEAFAIDPDAGTWSHERRYVGYDGTGAKDYEEEEKRRGTFTMLPEGVRFLRGNTVTFRAIQNEYEHREWDAITGWGPLTTSDHESVALQVITHMGDFLIMDGESSYRSVFGMAE